MVKVLILEDDAEMRNKHVECLKEAGFECCSTDNGKEAIDWVKRDLDIKFALIDQILFVPPIPKNDKEAVLQDFQGEGVIREINLAREDVEFIFITFAPEKESERKGNDKDTLLQMTGQLKYENRRIIDFIHKSDIENNEDKVYSRIIELIRGRLRTAEGRTPTYIINDQRLLECARHVCRVSPLRSVNGRVERAQNVSGTGWLIAPCLILTCWHVVEARNPLEPNASREDLNHQIENFRVTFHRRQLSDGVDYEIETCLHHNADLDYALLRLKNRTEHQSKLGRNDFLCLDTEAPINEQTRLLVIHHALGQPQQRSHGWFVSCSNDKSGILHDATTFGGASGSPTLDAESFRVIAMHRGRDEGRGLAEAMLIKVVMEDLEMNCSEAYKEITKAQTRLYRRRS